MGRIKGPPFRPPTSPADLATKGGCVFATPFLTPMGLLAVILNPFEVHFVLYISSNTALPHQSQRDEPRSQALAKSRLALSRSHILLWTDASP
jgi:hypothetical protein